MEHWPWVRHDGVQAFTAGILREGDDVCVVLIDLLFTEQSEARLNLIGAKEEEPGCGKPTFLGLSGLRPLSSMGGRGYRYEIR